MLIDLKPKLDLCKKQTVGFGSIVEVINAARQNDAVENEDLTAFEYKGELVLDGFYDCDPRVKPDKAVHKPPAPATIIP